MYRPALVLFLAFHVVDTPLTRGRQRPPFFQCFQSEIQPNEVPTMKVTVIGTGYVGLVAGACLAETGNDVICADIDEGKIARLNGGEIPIYEPGLEPLIASNLESARLRFTTDVPESVRASDIIFIAVGTPPDEDGSADLQHVLAVARTIGQAMNGEKIVITKSTVPVGTPDSVREAIEGETDIRSTSAPTRSS